ncbi:MAG: BMP family protein [Bacillota bacterium]
MKKVLSAIICLLLVLLFAFPMGACSGPASSDDGLKVALMLNGTINDASWNQSAYEGVKKMESELGATIAYTENIKQNDKVQIMREYAKQGFDYIIGHGYDYEDAIVEVSKEFPDVKFVGVVTGCTGTNVASVRFLYGQLGHCAGIIAANCTKTKQIGFISAVDNENIRADVNNLKKVVAEIDPAIKIVDVYTGDYNDINKAKEAALALIDGGADVVIGTVDAGNVGVFQAAIEKNVMVMGWIQEQYDLGPNNILTSGVMDVAEMLFQAVKGFEENGFEGKEYKYGMVEGVQFLGKFSSLVPDDVKQKALDAQQQIIDGKLVVDTY